MKDAETEQGLEPVYRDHGARLWRAVFAFAGDRQVADDAVAEAFAQALRRGQELRDPLAWIWRVAFRVAAGELKDRRAHHAALIDEPYEMPEPAWEIMRALARLSPMQRASVVLHHYGGYPTKDIAVILGSTAAAVRVHLSAGRRRFSLEPSTTFRGAPGQESNLRHTVRKLPAPLLLGLRRTTVR